MAKQKNKRWSDYLWIVSATYFTLGFFNIIFAWLGVICFLIPLLIAVFGGSKAYCNNYCGRGQLFLQIGNTLGWSRKKVAPRWLSSKWFRNAFLIFFLFFFILFYSNDYLDRSCSNGCRISARDYSFAMDFQRALALGLSHGSGALGCAICFWTLWYYAYLSCCGGSAYYYISSAHLVRVLPYG